MKTPFDSMFDYNNDGQLDWMEKGARDAFFIQMIEESENEGTDPDEEDDDPFGS